MLQRLGLARSRRAVTDLRTERALVALALGSIALVSARTALAWGPVGHRVVADVAEKNLTPATKAAVKKILGLDVSLADVANWADDYRVTDPTTYNWHFGDIPLAANDYVPSRDCAPNPTKGDCVINALTREVAILKDTSASDDDRLMALRCVVHFVGDEHQPFHAEDHNDKGGNAVAVTWFGKEDNLHRVWDTDIIEEEHLGETALAGQPNASMTKKQKTATQTGTFVDWALEAHKDAQAPAYADLPKPSNGVLELDDGYYQATVTTVNIQLARAGFRLAKVLNDALGAKKPKKGP